MSLLLILKFSCNLYKKKYMTLLMFGHSKKNIHVQIKTLTTENLSFQKCTIKIGDENVVNNINGEIYEGKIKLLMAETHQENNTNSIFSLGFT